MVSYRVVNLKVSEQFLKLNLTVAHVICNFHVVVLFVLNGDSKQKIYNFRYIREQQSPQSLVLAG